MMTINKAVEEHEIPRKPYQTVDDLEDREDGQVTDGHEVEKTRLSKDGVKRGQRKREEYRTELKSDRFLVHFMKRRIHADT